MLTLQFKKLLTFFYCKSNAFLNYSFISQKIYNFLPPKWEYFEGKYLQYSHHSLLELQSAVCFIKAPAIQNKNAASALVSLLFPAFDAN